MTEENEVIKKPFDFSRFTIDEFEDYTAHQYLYDHFYGQPKLFLLATAEMAKAAKKAGYSGFKQSMKEYVQIEEAARRRDLPSKQTCFIKQPLELNCGQWDADDHLLSALGLENGANRYEKADSSDKLSASNYYYQSDVLISALKSALEANATTVKNALEAYITANGGTAMPLTDTYGKTKAENLDLGLYLLVETKVPEMVTSTCNPFFISLPMTSGDGGSWIYDVTVYPKNLTGDPTLDKTLRESKDDTGKNNGSASITDGFAAAGTASDGDIVDYQIVSTLPSITSASTYLTDYTFVDTLSKGITYNKNDVVLEFFTDSACTQKVATWREGEGKFTVTYGTADAGESKMTIEMTAEGLKEINTSKAVYAESSMVNSGYSDCTLRITYAATVSSSADVVYGDNGNPNEVVLTWKRTSQDSYDTLKDAAKVYTYGLELTKLFSDGNRNMRLFLLPIGRISIGWASVWVWWLWSALCCCRMCSCTFGRRNRRKEGAMSGSKGKIIFMWTI